jgi:hypothetical protein
MFSEHGLRNSVPADKLDINIWISMCIQEIWIIEFWFVRFILCSGSCLGSSAALVPVPFGATDTWDPSLFCAWSKETRRFFPVIMFLEHGSPKWFAADQFDLTWFVCIQEISNWFYVYTFSCI